MKYRILIFIMALAINNYTTGQVTDRWIPLDDPAYDFKNFIIDPVDTNRIYATHLYGISKSINGGASWTDIDIVIYDDINAIVLNPVSRDTLYVGVIAIGTGGVGVYRSANRGNTWTQVYSVKSVSCLALNPIKPWVIYAGTATDTYEGDAIGILKSTNAGAGWEQINNGLGNLEINWIAVNPADPEILFTGTNGGIYKSSNGGESWSGSGTGLPGGSVVNFIAINPADTSILYAGLQGDGLYKSSDGGKNWSSSSSGITNSIINWITINPDRPEIMYVSVDDGGVFRSLNGGNNWSQMDLTGVTNVFETRTIRLNPLNPDIIYSLFGYGTSAAQIYKRLEDFTPPETPVNLKGIPGDKQVTLTWKMNEDADLANYKIYRDSVLVTSIPVAGPEDTVFTDTGLTNMQAYRYMLTAVDKKENESDFSQEIIVIPYFRPLGLVAWFPLDGNSADITGNGNDGVSYDCQPAKNRYDDANTCYDFNGTSSFINCGNHFMLDITDQVTLLAWIYPQSAEDTAYIISKAQLCDHSANYNLRLLPGGKIEFAFKDGTGPDIAFQSSGAIPLNKWTHVAVSYDFKSHNIDLFFNATATDGDWTVAGTPQEQAPVITTNDLSIGASVKISGDCYSKDPGEPISIFNGLIDEVYIYNVILNTDEIKEIAETGPKAPSNLKAAHCNGMITLTEETYTYKNVKLIRIFRDDQSPAIILRDSVMMSDISDTLYQDLTGYGNTWYYRIKAVDSSGIESNFSNEVMIVAEKTVDLGADQDLCQGEFVILDAGEGFFSYEWSVDGNTERYLTVNKSGDYWVKVTDTSQSCISYDSINILVHQNPSVELGPDRKLCPGSTLVLRADPGYNNYLWNTGGKSDTLVVTEPGNYWVTVASGGSCEGFDEVTVAAIETYQDQKICLVTVDPKTDRLMIIWEKEPGHGIDSFKIYREGDIIGNYELITTIPYNQLSIFIDTLSEPGNQQYLYKISVADSCGNQSELSPYHKTLFLQYTGSVGGVNLEWSEYEVEDGFISFVSYEIYRGTSSTDLTLIKTLSASLDRYIDSDPGALTTRYFYRIAGVLMSPCYPAGSLKSDPEPYIHSVSNLENNHITGQDLPESNEKILNIYPNPVSEKTVVTFSNPVGENYSLSVMNLTGKMIQKINGITGNRIEIDCTGLTPGIYFIELSGKEVVRGKLIVK